MGKPKRFVIGVDIDNVLTDTDTKIRELIKKYLGIDAQGEDIIDWHYHRSLPITQEDESYIFDLFHQYHCQELNIIPNSKESLDSLSKYSLIYLITNRPKFTSHSTKSWLNQHNIHFDKITFTKDKEYYFQDMSFLVEDKGETALSFANLGKPVFLLDHPWNHSFFHDNIIRVSSWLEIDAYFRMKNYFPKSN